MKLRVFALLLAAIVPGTFVDAQLPALSWTCPMHPEIVEGTKAKCNICGMALEPVRLVTMYTCPVHAVIEESKPGKCRICSRDLVAMTAELTFACAGNREVGQIDPGKCADGSAMVPKYKQRAHGDHNPKHGGIFFMAPDSWHHLEGTYPAAGRLRVYVYDDYSKPLKLADARQVRGRIVTKEVFDAKTGTTRELASAPLVLAQNGAFFEARIESLVLPAKVTAKIAFRSGDKENRFDFTFPEYSKDLPARITASTSAAKNAPAGDKPGGPGAQVTPGAPANSLLSDLEARRAELETLVKSGSLAGIYVPALQAKDTALEIQTRHAGARDIDQDALEASVKQIVLAAYQLDNYGDIGDGQKVQEAFAMLAAGIGALDSLLTGRR
jgi:hypothetical protein